MYCLLRGQTAGGGKQPQLPRAGQGCSYLHQGDKPALCLQNSPWMYPQEVQGGAVLPAGKAAGCCADPFPGAGSTRLSVAASRHGAAGAAGDKAALQCPSKSLYWHLRVSSKEIEATAEASRFLPREQLYWQHGGRESQPTGSLSSQLYRLFSHLTIRHPTQSNTEQISIPLWRKPKYFLALQ